MKRRKLIELLNLYNDGEISSDEQESLELEIAENEESRRIYNQYCRLDDATRLVYQQFRLQAPPESIPDPQIYRSFRGPIGRLRRFSVVAGGAAAAIAMVSSALVVFGPSMPESGAEVIALTPGGNTANTSMVAIAPAIQSFETASTFELKTAAFGPQVPADWTPGIEIPVPAQSLDTAPQAWPVHGGIRWNAPRSIHGGLSLSGTDNSRVYRGPERLDSDEPRQVSFQFRK